jgi:hypothetical protein
MRTLIDAHIKPTLLESRKKPPRALSSYAQHQIRSGGVEPYGCLPCVERLCGKSSKSSVCRFLLDWTHVFYLSWADETFSLDGGACQ